MDNPDARRLWKLKQVFAAEILTVLQGDFGLCRVPFMPIKGAYLIAAGLAPKMQWRTMDDLDLLVDECNYAKVRDFFLNRRRLTCVENEYDFKFTIKYPLGSASALVEIHRKVSHTQRFDLKTEDVFSRGRLECGTMRLPSAEDALLITIAHALVHIGFEMRPTLLDEIDLIVSQKEFSPERFWQICLPSGLAAFTCFLLRLKGPLRGLQPDCPGGHYYARLASLAVLTIGYDRFPHCAKRIFLEFPFVKSPLSAIIQMVRQKKPKQNQQA
jgi:hypothetical protein